MDKAWKHVFDKLAKSDELHKIGCWNEEDFEDLTKQTNTILDRFLECQDCLDVGCGPGYYCDLLHKKGITPTGIDYSEEIIEKAKELYPNLEFTVDDAYDLSFDDDSFDLVLSIGLLQCVYDHETAIHEMSRVAKEAMIISTLYRDEEYNDPMKKLHEKLQYDAWPTRTYHPNELIPILREYGWDVEKVVTKDTGDKINGGFFLICT